MKNVLFNANGLSVGYGRKPLTDNISFSVKGGEILTLIGPNGAGKSTVLKSITRQLKAIDGIVTLDDRDLFTMPMKELAGRMSVVLTDRVSPELMTCRQVVELGRYPYTGYFGTLTAKDTDAVNAALERVAAVDIADRSFNEISDGQRQRIMLARALCQEPDVIVLDEPVSYLDIKYKIALLGILRRMASVDGIAVIMSLHELDFASKVSDRILCIGDGKIKLGTPEEIFTGSIINKLYDINDGSYDTLLGSAEFGKMSFGAGQGRSVRPDVLVIGGNGSGIPVYRRLWRRGTPFFAGVLFENDIDFRVASQLAEEVVAQKAFTRIDDAIRSRAFEILGKVSTVIDCGCIHGEYDIINRELTERAMLLNKEVVRL